ncbi:hypothetical protein ALC53_05679 [Atta colombica]|uniref:Uncharacterized protein n=1 Tax=Atta colombica TaxID=520822 RepID=A0A151I475_9HYME|nr:hypothetical protein ALC53_05679 [Atta colombica]
MGKSEKLGKRPGERYSTLYREISIMRICNFNASPNPAKLPKRKPAASTLRANPEHRASATCLGVKKAEEATEEETEDQEIVGKRAIRFHYPSHRSSNFDTARNAQIYINLSAVVSLAALSCEAGFDVKVISRTLTRRMYEPNDRLRGVHLVI